MMNAGRAGWLTAALMAAAITGCATTHGDLHRSADRLDRSAQSYAENSEEAPRGYSENTGYTEDARDFAERAHEFRRTIDEEGADNDDARAAFDKLSRSYHELRDDVQRDGDRDARRDLAPLTQAYLDVEDDMGGAVAPDRYSDEGDDRGG